VKKKYVLCDSSSLISLTGSCLDSLLYYFRDNFGTRFLIPPSVEYEAVARPLSLRTKIYCFSALRIKDMINDGVVEVLPEDAKSETKELMDIGNKIFYARGRPIRLIHLGETEMLAIARKLDVHSLLMDERTTRVLVENPVSLAKHFEKEFHTNVMVNKKNLSSFTQRVGRMDVIRTTELAYLASESGFFKNFGDLEPQAVEAALYKLKFSGCAISFRELEEYSRMME
jgi:hypothetical protein